jgi:hypothetical protein
VIPVGIEESTDELVFFEDGRPPRSPVHVMLSEFDMGRLRAGYICLQCKEDLDTAFPDECPVCHYRMAARQAEDFATQFKGTTHVGPSTTIEEEKEIMVYLRQKEAREKELRYGLDIVKPQIIVPTLRGVR